MIELGDSHCDIQLKLLFSVIVAGKSAKFAEQALYRFVDFRSVRKPFTQIKYLVAAGRLEERLRLARTGNYSKIAKAFAAIVKAKIDFKTVTPTQLEEIHGIGPKTSRFFVMWIRPLEIYAALDVHVLRWMRLRGIETPRSTPSGNKYAALEVIFIDMAKKRGMTPRQLDELIWMAGSQGKTPPS